jgi:hypothetical protein
VQKLEPFAYHSGVETGDAGKVAAGTVKGGN